MLRLNRFTYDEDDMGNECGLAVEFRNCEHIKRNAVVMSKYGRRNTPRETAMALRLLADWCDEQEGK